MRSTTIKIRHNFYNFKNEKKEVSFYIDEKLYKDILTLKKEEREYWLTYFYHEYCKEENQRKKELRNVELNVNKDNDLDNLYVEKEDNLMLQVSEKCDVEKILLSLEESERELVKEVIMYETPILELSKKIGISEATIRKKIKKIKKSLRSKNNKK